MQVRHYQPSDWADDDDDDDDVVVIFIIFSICVSFTIFGSIFWLVKLRIMTIISQTVL